MKRFLPMLVVVIMILGTILSACAAPPPQTVEKVVTQVVEKEVVKEVEKVVTQVVEKEKVVEKVVEATAVPPTVAPEVPAEKQMGGTVNVWLPNGWTDKHWSYLTNWESTFAVSPMAEFLFWPKPDGTLEPMLATGYDVSDDGLVYTVKMREGVKWHDGEPFTAEDAAYTYWMHANPNLKPLGWIYNGQTVKDYVNFNGGKATDITGIKVIDPLTLEITLDSPDASLPRTFLTYGQIPVLPKHILEKMPDDVRFNTSNPDAYWTEKPVGTGPFKFVRYVEDQYIEYERNDAYWGGPVGPEKLFMKISDPNVAMIALEKGELDYMYPTQLSEVKRLQQNPNLELIEAKNQGQFFGLIPNYMTMDGAWRDPKVKQALLMSVDRQAYVNTILQGYGTVRHSPMDGTAYACPTMKKWDFDPVAADALWTEAGWPKEKRAEWTMDFMSWTGNKPRLDYLPILHEAVRKMGFKANIDIIDNSTINDYLGGNGPRGKDYDTQVLLWGPGEDPQKLCNVSDLNNKTNAGVWGCPDSWNTTIPFDTYMGTCWKYDNKRVQEICSLTAEETDAQKRIELFQEMDCILNEEIPYFTTAAPSFVLSKSKRLQGVDWPTGASLGWWMALYKPGDLWLWQQ
jgi:peptide/nickel transport system substrate-binding protein